jgi:hypothetical protein
VSNLEVYLDRACGCLRVNPAEAEDIRRELRAHLEERVQEAVAGGVDVAEAVEKVLTGFGPAERVRAGLCEVHQTDPWWLSRLQCAALGALLGLAVISLLPFAQRLGLSPTDGPSPLMGAIIGAAIGLVSIPGRSPIAGLVVGSLGWMATGLAAFLTASTAPPSGDWVRPFNSLLLSPIVGSFFGVVVSAASASCLRFSLRLRRRMD